MSPKEKAIELVNKFYKYANDGRNGIYYDSKVWTESSKQCALIAVDEMLGEYQSMSDLESKIIINDEVRFVVHQLQYWMEVKQEIEKI